MARPRRQLRAGVVAAAAVAAAVIAVGAVSLGSRGTVGRDAAPSPPPTPSPSGTGPGAGDWTQFGGSAARTGEGPRTPAMSGTRTAWTATLDGLVYASPIGAGGAVYVATENDSVYALDAVTGAQRWRVHLGEPMAGKSLPCGNIDPSGITSTPALDPATGLLYVVAFVQPGRHRLFALEAATGRVRFQRDVDAAGADPLTEQQRGALTFSRGTVYIPYGGLLGDCAAYRGSVVSVRADGGGELGAWVVDAPRQGGIWASGGARVDPETGDLFLSTGNSPGTGRFEFGNAVVRLSPSLKLLDWFAPRDWAELSARDADLGSATPAAIAPGFVLQVGKSGVGYVMRADHLGNVGGSVADFQVCRQGSGGSYGADATSGGLTFVPCQGGLAAVRMPGPTGGLAVHWRSAEAAQFGPPVVAYGYVWSISTAGVLFGLDPATGRSVHRLNLGGRLTPHFVEPAPVGRMLMVPVQNRIVAMAAAPAPSTPPAGPST